MRPRKQFFIILIRMLLSAMVDLVIKARSWP